jgi:outer membrane protein OmpA-like peptidoglycan-associated protein
LKPLISTLLLLSAVYTHQSIAQTCESGNNSSAVNSYVLQNDGTAFDKTTNLTWMRCALGQTWDGVNCQGVPQLLQWETAMQMAKTTTFAGQGNWRLPDLTELQSIINRNCENPAIDLIAFPNVPPSSVYWSSSTITDPSSGAWSVNFYDADDYWGYLYDYNAVRLVRDGMIEKPQPKAVAPSCDSLDSDKDGVNDCLDKCPNSMIGSKVNADGCPISIELKGVQFELDSAVLTANSKTILEKVARDLIAYSGDKKPIEVQGHTSSEAPTLYNLKLSQRRAQAVVDYLKKQGVKDKLSAKGYGEDHPVADNKTQMGRVRNRRVELHWLEH